jgi:DNA (cytosine-5)-methyltransferase 1
MSYQDLLQNVYDTALELAFKEPNIYTKLENNIKERIDYLASHSENNKGVITVLITLLSHKILTPTQDIRYHQAGLDNGFSGRNIDSNHITPFMKNVSFPSMAESGWLTRSLEQPHPYTLDYPGKITPTQTKDAFLTIIDMVQTKGIDAKEILIYLFALLIRQRDSKTIELAKPHGLPISAIINLLTKHFSTHYNCSGASRLPTLAVFAAYQCMMPQVARYKDKKLCPLENHNSADSQSGRIGDIDVNREDGTAFEGIEIKHEIIITKEDVTSAYEKFKTHNTDRYYLLTTSNMDSIDWDETNKEIQRIAQIHGCQVIVNGVLPTLKYYLRLFDNPAKFVDFYVESMKTDNTIKFQHKTKWNDIVSGN